MPPRTRRRGSHHGSTANSGSLSSAWPHVESGLGFRCPVPSLATARPRRKVYPEPYRPVRRSGEMDYRPMARPSLQLEDKHGSGPERGWAGQSGGGMTSQNAVFVESVSAMLRFAQSDPEKARVALAARGDQVLAALRDSLLPAAKDSQRIVALIDLYMQATFEMLFEAARSDDRIVFGEAEIKAWAVAGALDRGAEGALKGDRDALMASMRAAEAILGLDLMSAWPAHPRRRGHRGVRLTFLPHRDAVVLSRRPEEGEAHVHHGSVQEEEREVRQRLRQGRCADAPRRAVRRAHLHGRPAPSGVVPRHGDR